MNYHIDKNAVESAYLQLYRRLREDVVSGAYPFGAKMPSKRQLADDALVSLVTVEHAYAILCDEGYLESRERSGYYVAYRAGDCFPGTAAAAPRDAHAELRAAADEFPFSVLARTMRRVLSDYGEALLVKSPNNGCAALRRASTSGVVCSSGAGMISVFPIPSPATSTELMIA